LKRPAPSRLTTKKFSLLFMQDTELQNIGQVGGLLAENMDDTEKLNQIIICRERWLAQRREVLEMNKAPGFNDEAKIDGEHLAAVLAWGAKEINIRGLHCSDILILTSFQSIHRWLLQVQQLPISD
jgi:hypothetical protein